MRTKLLLLSAFLFSLFAFAQVPQGVSYQAIALNGAGSAVVSSNVGIRISILDNSASGTVLYTETHIKMTNPQGLFNLVIGEGTAVTGTFAVINWKINPKFLKVEMDVAGGTNYVLTGTTQLLAVPYALAADGLVMSAGENLTLYSPNGTPYALGVNDSGQLSLPTSGASSSAPSNLYLYGTFNSWNAATALQFGAHSGQLRGFKYMTAGTQLKFLAAQNENVVYGGNGLSGQLVPNGNAITIPSNGFYRINVTGANYTITSINVSLLPGSLIPIVMNYNVAGGYFGVTNSQGSSNVTYKFAVDTTGSQITYGDNLTDGYIEVDGVSILITAGGTKTWKLYLNFDGYGNYTVVGS